VRGLVLEYYFVLRTVLRKRPELRPCLRRCRHCRIFFLTHPRNRERDDLGCPFGCRESHQGKCSAERSAAYYRTEAGREKKRRLNARRRAAPDRVETQGGEVSFEAGIVEHVRMVASLIEGRRVSHEQILEMLARGVRQHRIAGKRASPQTARRLRAKPP
jgi:hypothetical protein